MFDDGDRVHIGAISQDVEDAMKELGIEPEQFRNVVSKKPYSLPFACIYTADVFEPL